MTEMEATIDCHAAGALKKPVLGREATYTMVRKHLRAFIWEAYENDKVDCSGPRSRRRKARYSRLPYTSDGSASLLRLPRTKADAFQQCSDFSPGATELLLPSDVCK